MKALPKILLALTAVAALSVAHPAKANLITNPGFEAGVTGWTFNFGASWGSGPVAHSGFAFGLMPTAVFTHPTIAQSVATTSGATYTISFFVSCFASAPSNFAVNFGGTVFNNLFA
jgi:chitinase